MSRFDVGELRDLQLERLRALLHRVGRAVPLYADRLGPSPTIHDLTALATLPTTTKEDLRAGYPFALSAVRRESIARIHASSGTTGRSTLALYTRNDLRMWSTVMARCLALTGVRADDIVQNAYSYGPFTGGLGFHDGAEALGAAILPMTSGGTERQVILARDVGSTVFCSTPSYFAHFVEHALERGLSFGEDLKLRIAVLGAEPWSEPFRARLERETGLKAFDMYGLSEVIGPGVAVECGERDGLHIMEDHFFPEIVDPTTGAPVAQGGEGELVITTLTKEAAPLLRYRTGDITRQISDPCACGSIFRRIARISRRVDDMFPVRGVNVYPQQIEEVLLSVDSLAPHYEIVVDDARATVRVELLMGVSADVGSTMRVPLEERLRAGLGVGVQVEICEVGTIPRVEGKSRRILDRRSTS